MILQQQSEEVEGPAFLHTVPEMTTKIRFDNEEEEEKNSVTRTHLGTYLFMMA